MNKFRIKQMHGICEYTDVFHNEKFPHYHKILIIRPSLVYQIHFKSDYIFFSTPMKYTVGYNLKPLILRQKDPDQAFNVLT